VIVLVSLGVVPRPLVDSRLAASEQVLRLRAVCMSAARLVKNVRIECSV
jgi:hypothetical protein